MKKIVVLIAALALQANAEIVKDAPTCYYDDSVLETVSVLKNGIKFQEMVKNPACKPAEGDNVAAPLDPYFETDDRAVIQGIIKFFPLDFLKAIPLKKIISAVIKTENVAAWYALNHQSILIDNGMARYALVHEMGHALDFRDRLLDRTITDHIRWWQGDPFQNQTKHREEYVSDYAMTNPDEDYAETFRYMCDYGTVHDNPKVQAKINLIKEEAESVSPKMKFAWGTMKRTFYDDNPLIYTPMPGEYR